MVKKKEAVKRKVHRYSSKSSWKSAGLALVLVLASIGALFALDGGSITGLTAKDIGGCLAVDLSDGKEQTINIQSGVLNNLVAGENTAKFKLITNGKNYDFYLYPTDETLAKETIKSGETKQFYFSSVCGGEADLSVKIVTKGFVGRAIGGKDQAVLKWLKKKEAPVQICGNGKVEEEIEPWEECDDANKLNNDGCSAYCLLEPPTEEGEWDCVSPENEPTKCAWVPVELPEEIHPKAPAVAGGIIIDLSDGKLHIVNVSDEAGNVLIRIGPTDYRFVVDVVSATRADINIYREGKPVFGKKGVSFKSAEYADLDADIKIDLYMMINNGKDKGLVEVQLRWEKPKEKAVSEEEISEEQIPIWDLSETDKEGDLDDATGEIKFELNGKVYILKVDVSGTSCLNNAMSIYLDNTSNLVTVNKALVVIKQFDLDKDGVNDLKVEIKSCKDQGKVNVVLSWLNKPAPEETIKVIDLSDGEQQEIEIDDNGKVKIKVGENEYELQIDGSAELGAVEKTCVITKVSILVDGEEIASQSGSKMTKEFDLDKDGVNDLSVEITACEDKGKIKVNLQWINMPVAAEDEIIKPKIKVSAPATIIPTLVGKEVVFNASVEFLGEEATSPLVLTFVADAAKIEATAKTVIDEPAKLIQEFHWLPKKTGVYTVEVVGAYNTDVPLIDKVIVTINVTGAKHKFSGYVTNSKEGQSVFVQTPELLFDEPITANKTYGMEKEFAVYGANGTILMFFVNDTGILNYTLSDGQVTELNLTVPSTVTTTDGETQPAPAPSGSPSSGGGGSPGYGPSKETTLGEIPSICYYQWSCTEWSSCFGGEQTRTCERTDECDTFLEANPDLTVIAYPQDAESKKCAIAKKEAAPKAPAQPKITLETAAPEIGEPAPTKEKKLNLGLILSLVAGALLLAAAGILIWWKMKPKRPTAMAYPSLKR